MSDSVLKRLDKKPNKLEMHLVFWEDSQSYFQETFVSLNLSVAMTVNSYFQVYQVDSGTTASMWSSYWTTIIASKKIQNMEKC
jgi:hypothetical protein